jgi:hypothetical protein
VNDVDPPLVDASPQQQTPTSTTSKSNEFYIQLNIFFVRCNKHDIFTSVCRYHDDYYFHLALVYQNDYHRLE